MMEVSLCVACPEMTEVSSLPDWGIFPAKDMDRKEAHKHMVLDAEML